MEAKINPKLEGIIVKDLLLEETTAYQDGGIGNWKLYYAQVNKGDKPIFLLQRGAGAVQLGSTSIFYKLLNLPGRPPAVPFQWERRVAHAIKKADYELEETYKRILSKNQLGLDWSNFEDTFSHYQTYEVTTPISEEELLRMEPEEVEKAIENHVCGGYELDERIKAWGYGNLIRFPTVRRLVPWTKFRGHSLIVKSTKSGCSHIAHRTGPTYDKVTPKSFEGFADAEGNIFYSPLHDNYHACVLDEVDQLDDGIMSKLFAFMESGEYTAVKATKRIQNLGNSRLSFVTNPKSMEETKGVIFSSNTTLDAFYDVLFKLTNGNFGGGMSRFGLVLISNTITQAKGKSLPWKYQEYCNAVAQSVFELNKGRNAQYYEDEQIQTWLSSPIENYDAAITEMVAEFEDDRLRKAWTGQLAAYRHVRGAALEISLAENASRILREPLGVDELLEYAEQVLDSIIGWNLRSLREIINVCQKEETIPQLAARIQNSKPAYIAPVVIAAYRAKGGLGVDLEAAYDSLPRQSREAIGGSQYCVWSHISRRLNSLAMRRLCSSLRAFDIRATHLPEFQVTINPKSRVVEAVNTILLNSITMERKNPDLPLPVKVAQAAQAATPTLEKPLENLPEQVAGPKTAVAEIENLPRNCHAVLTPVGGNQGSIGTRNGVGGISPYVEATSEKSLSPNSITMERIKFKEGGGYETEKEG